MSRALGDLKYKNPVNTVASSTPARGDFISNDPYTSRRTLQPDGRYVLVIVSDGVSDRVDDAGLIEHVMKMSMRGMRASDIAQEVATSCGSHPRSDNASCIVAMLDGHGS